MTDRVYNHGMNNYGFTVPTSGYDDEDRLVGWERADSNLDQSWSLSLVGDWDGFTEILQKFDALGRRISRDDGTTTMVYVPSGQQTIADYTAGTAASSPTYRYGYASDIDEPEMRAGSTSTAKLYYHRNQQYSVTALTDAAGTISERYAYDAYGKLTVLDGGGTVRSGSAYGNRYTYTGREWDDGVGLYHYRARMHSADSGRFASRDLIGFKGSPWNLYEYVGSMPLTIVDPSGLCPPGYQKVTPVESAEFSTKIVKDGYFKDPDLGTAFPGPPPSGTVSPVVNGCYTVTQTCALSNTCIKYTGKMIKEDVIKFTPGAWELKDVVFENESKTSISVWRRTRTDTLQQFEQANIVLEYSCVTNRMPYSRYHTSATIKGGQRTRTYSEQGTGLAFGSEGTGVTECTDPDGKHVPCNWPVTPSP